MTAEPPVAHPRRRVALWLAVVAFVAAVAIATPMIWVQQQLGAARADYTAAAGEIQDATAALETVRERADETRSLADAVLAAADGQHGDPDALAALSDATGELTRRLDGGELVEVPTVPSSVPDSAAEELRDHAEGFREQAAGVRRGAAELEAATGDVTAAGEAYMVALPEAAASVEARFASAANLARIAYREVTASLPEESWAPDAPTTVSTYASVVAILAASHAAEEAEKAGPLYNARAEVEAFARSIAGGVMLDFDWAPIVNGYGANGSYGGTATWNTGHGGYSTITLSDSVAAQWHRNPAVASLVAHEVGHSITSKCMALFVDGFDSQPEVFATAWAIGLGYEREGNGESLYGRPSDELIELSRGCR
ncbi:hypothetical protein FVA74_00565 [Salinibacterium sp. dk2585]|uniref:hypothetical protein n=1 Tax=unclassified Salinibacterium TaxID=2632331 RepID=UPI0011C255FE|nr:MULTISPECIES: hypothetical protein [unclassified Salinibacterium]QEE60219.1 hypothetical protein FVA74_00565 [Salinibacterium sp. dk2585]TXK55291.1 hypothetical protein FVP63_00710 [Salinibacterium sp. dk5596]